MSSIEKRAHKFSKFSNFKLTYVTVVQNIGMNFNFVVDVHNLNFFGYCRMWDSDHWI